MQPVRLLISGSYWDTQLYEGRLYLFGRAGDILTLNWDSLIDSLKTSEPLALALTCAFQRSDYLYGMAAAGLMKDSEMRTIVGQKFIRLSNQTLDISSEALNHHVIEKQDNPLPFPHTDTEIYARKLYSASKSGVSVVTCNKKTTRPVSTRVTKIWDASVLGISASYGSLAIAAGSEGLFEKRVTNYEEALLGQEDPVQISQSHCSDCGWVFYSVFGSSSLGPGFLASYERESMEDDPRFRRRRFDRVIKDREIFGAEHEGARAKYSWASQDKICRAVNGTIDVARYTPWEKEEDQRIKPIGTLPFQGHQGNIVSAAVALFGTVVELDSSLVVLPSIGPSIQLQSEPVNWRVFPRSKHYENHLHIVHNDCLEILSFNHDYLVNQQEKVSGIRYYPGKDKKVRPL